MLLVGVERDRVAIRIATAATTTTTTATTTTFAGETGFARLVFATGCASIAVGIIVIVSEVRDRGGVEDFGLGRCTLRRSSSDQIPGRDLLGFLRRSGSGGLTRRRRRAGSGEVAREHALERLDEVFLAEPAAILDLVFAGELSEVFDAECGEIRLIRHVPMVLRKTLRIARRYQAG
jgi:hypothetical protein